MKTFVTLAAVVLAMTGCATTGPFNNAKDNFYATNDFYLAKYEGRTYLFDDQKVWSEFVQFGEPTYRKTQIGAGKQGETLVYGMTKAQAKELEKKVEPFAAAMEVYMGKLTLADDMYAEVYQDGRYHVFTDMANLKAFLETGEVVYRFTDVAAGPNGKTVVYALPKAVSDKKPEAAMAEFKKRHQAAEKLSLH